MAMSSGLHSFDIWPEHVNGAERRNFPLTAELYLRDSRSDDLPLRSAHAPLDFLIPAHRSGPLI